MIASGRPSDSEISYCCAAVESNPKLSNHCRDTNARNPKRHPRLNPDPQEVEVRVPKEVPSPDRAAV